MTKAKDMTDIFRTPGSEKDGKARRTDDAAWAIIVAESEKRDAKTARLRAARLAKEAQAVVETPAGPAVRNRRKK
jgi:hypothetical protein